MRSFPEKMPSHMFFLMPTWTKGVRRGKGGVYTVVISAWVLSLGVLGPEVVPDVISVKLVELQETMSIQIALGTAAIAIRQGVEG